MQSNQTPLPDANTLLYLRREDVQTIARTLDWVELLRQVFILHGSGDTVLPDEAYLRWTNGTERLRSLAMPAYVGAPFEVAGTKVINSNPSNIDRGLPRADGLLLLHDRATGRVSCVMHGSDLSALRTAGVTMLAAELLGSSLMETVAIIGAGELGRAHCELIPTYLKTVKRVLLYDARKVRALQLQADFERTTRDSRIELSVEDSATSAIEPADLVIAVTTTTTPYIKYQWLKPGCLVVNVSLDDVEADVMLKCDLLVVDDWHLVRQDDKRLLGRMIRAGQVVGPGEVAHPPHCRAVDAQLAQIVTGSKVGRRAVGDIVLVNPFGLAIEDVAIGIRVQEAAAQYSLGLRLPR